MEKKSCKKGYYYCYTSKKCKKIPKGWHVMPTGMLMRDSEHKDENKEETKKKNGNGTNGNGNGNGDSSGSTDGGGVSEAWSAKYKRSINCDNPRGFSQRAHCQGRKKVNEAKGHEGDHEVSMAQSQLKKSEKNIAKLRKALGKKERNIPAWVQAKITDTEHNTDAAAGYMDEANKSGDRSLRDWFTKSRASDGTPGWVQLGGKYAGKPCAKQPGQKTKPKCGSSKMARNLDDKEEESAFRRKNRKDKNPNRRGAPINVATEKKKKLNASYSNWRAELEQLDEVAPLVVAAGLGALAATPYLAKKFLKPKADKALQRGRNELHLQGNPIGAGARGLDKQSYEPEGELVDEGKKDACYHKVKSRYKIWPSAYASGALVKCRKVGAKNWGNTSEGYDYSNWRDDFQATEYESVNIIETEPLQSTKGIGSDVIEAKSKAERLKEISKQLSGASKMHAQQSKKVAQVADNLEEAKKCWKGYKKAGTQKLFGKTYNRCVKAHFSDWRADMDLQEKKAKKDYDGDGKIESGKDEYMGSRDKAIKKAIAMREDWQKVNKKDKTDGMSQKAVNAYKRENPGSKLKTAVTEKDPGPKRSKRRKSFCSRSKGQQDMHNIDCSKTPDKAICKARRRWRC